MARFSDSHWHNSSTVTGTFVQQWFARFFNSQWHNSSTLSSTIYQQWPAQFFNSHGQDFFFFLCWQNFSTVMFTVERIFFLKKLFLQGLGAFFTNAKSLIWASFSLRKKIILYFFNFNFYALFILKICSKNSKK